MVDGFERDPLIGVVLDDKYRLDALLGEGGMGTVYRATHLLIDRPVAVKVLNPRLVSDAAAQERLRREARAAGRLRHTNAVAVTDFGQTSEGTVYIVMELLEGISLRDLLDREAPLAPGRAINLMLQISAAVAAAHELGIIHRDLKPGNIFIVERLHATSIIKVLDFGIAKAVENDGIDITQAQTLTETGMLIGTPRYMSPEQCDGATLTPAADVYSLGIIFYELLVGRTPFEGLTPLAVALKHSAEQPKPLREIVPEIPPLLEDFVLRALAKKPSERFTDAGEFRRELQRVANELGFHTADGFSSSTGELENSALGSFTNQKTGAPSARDTAENRISAATIAVGGQTAHAHAAKPDKDFAIRINQPVAETKAKQNSANLATTIEKLIRRPPILIGAGAFVLLLFVGLLSLALNRTSNPAGTNTANANSTTEILSAADIDDASIGGTNSNNTSTEPNANAANTNDPQTAVDFYERGAAYFSRRDFASAENDYRRAIELQPIFPAAYNRLGRALMAQGKFTEAASEFRRAIEQRDGNYPVAQYNLGDALARAGETESSIEAYRAAIANRGGTYPDARYQIGNILLRQKRNAEAAQEFQLAINEQGGNFPTAHLLLGVAYARDNKFPEAEAALRTAITQNKNQYPEAFYNLGFLYENNKRYADAIQAYETYLQQQPNAPNRREVERVIRSLRRRL